MTNREESGNYKKLNIAIETLKLTRDRLKRLGAPHELIDETLRQIAPQERAK